MKERNTPMRRCIGCMTSKEKKELVRITCYEGELSVDLTVRAKGRGAYLCRDNSGCWEKAYKKKALERSLGTPVSEEQKNSIFSQLAELKEKTELKEDR